MKNIVIIMIIMVIASCSCEDSQFVYNQDSTVTDKVTRLTWVSGGKEKSFIEALYYAERMTKKTGKKWSVPTYAQWKTIMVERGIFKSPFSNVKVNSSYWTSDNIGRTISDKSVNYVVHTKLVIAKMVSAEKGMKAVDDTAYLLLVSND